MWFKFPPGVSRISVQQQNFEVEYVNANGEQFFRVPDHFSPLIIGLGAGFEFLIDPPEGSDLPDLPKFASLSSKEEIDTLEDKLREVNENFSAMEAKLSATLAERDDLTLKVHELEAENADLKAKIEELEEAVPAAFSSKKK